MRDKIKSTNKRLDNNEINSLLVVLVCFHDAGDNFNGLSHGFMNGDDDDDDDEADNKQNNLTHTHTHSDGPQSATAT